MRVVIKLSTKTGRSSAHFVGSLACCALGPQADPEKERVRLLANKAQYLVARIMKSGGKE